MIQALLFFLCPLIICLGKPAFGASWPDTLDSQLGGHFKAKGSLAYHDSETALGQTGTSPFADGSADFRLKGEIFVGDHLSFKAHYVAAVVGGQTLEKINELQASGQLSTEYPLQTAVTDDDTRLFHLTRSLRQENDFMVYHQLDRLSATYQSSRVTVRLGRQAITWGNGMVFNPMDLFNPFSPTTIDKDYKTGEDMVYAQLYTDAFGEYQFLWVPRRDEVENSLETDASSFAAKVHHHYGTIEYDVLVARHYTDDILGLGFSGYLKDAAWRIDGTWTSPEEDSDKSPYLSLVANIDISWVWWDKNLYGFLEFYHNGMGIDSYENALYDHDIQKRIDRGQVFVLGKNYLTAHLNLEIHPLVNLYLTVMNNLHDSSGAVQPRMIWDARQNIKLTFGIDMYYGSRGTEYGGIGDPRTSFVEKPANAFYLWATMYF